MSVRTTSGQSGVGVEAEDSHYRLGPIARLAQVEESGLRGGEAEAEEDWG
jgi:hypothetical protein